MPTRETAWLDFVVARAQSYSKQAYPERIFECEQVATHRAIARFDGYGWDCIEGSCYVGSEVAEANERRLRVALFVGYKVPRADDEEVDSIFGIRRRVFGNRLLHGFASVQTGAQEMQADSDAQD